MTLKQSEAAGLFFADPPPAAGGVAELASWADQMFRKLDAFLRRPEFPGLVLTRIDTTLQPEFKAEDGFLVYAGPGVLGPNEGLYVREGGTWKKLAGT
jgi:hypothetical protein